MKRYFLLIILVCAISISAQTDGKFLSKGGCEYRILAIEKSAVLRPGTESLIAKWKAQGLSVYDNRTQPDDAMQQILFKAGIQPDVVIKSRRSALDRVFTTHRRTLDADIYFFVNHSEEHAFNDEIILRTPYAAAEWWNALSGSRTKLTAEKTSEGYLRLRLTLKPSEAGFVVASHPSESSIPVYETSITEDVQPITIPWTLTFDTTFGGPEKPIVINELFDLSTSDDPNIRYFSGLVTYDNILKLKTKPSGKLLIRIPGLQGVARVLVNGKEAGYIWCSPWEADITPLVKKGKNTLKIEVRTPFANALIGNAAKPESERKIWTYTQLYKPTAKLQPTGIVGEVLLVNTIFAPNLKTN